MPLSLMRLVGLCSAVFALSWSTVHAQPLWKNLVSRQSVEASETGDYRMTKKNGPWMILAATFSGVGAEAQASELVLELRRRYKLRAYTHAQSFDLSEAVDGLRADPDDPTRPERMRYRRSQELDEIHETAVLVGNYATFDDAEAQQVLQKIKRMTPDSLNAQQRKETSQSLAALRTIQTALLPKGHARKELGPMRRAFICRNPLLPRELFVPRGVDEFLENINSDVPYSLLDCPGSFTVQVATFTGKVILDPKQVNDIESGEAQWRSRLEKAGENAEKLAMALRQKGYDAYVFHERTASIVTVGSFESTGSPRSDGKIEIDPQIHAILRTFRASARTGSDALPDREGALTTHRVKTLVGIPFDLQPHIVQVPKRSISTAYFR